MKAIIIQPDGTHTVTEFTNQTSYRVIKDAVGGWIEAVNALDGDITFWCNEEGKIHGLPVNRTATALWWGFDPSMARVDFLVGTIVVTGGADPHGDTQGLTDDEVQALENLLP